MAFLCRITGTFQGHHRQLRLRRGNLQIRDQRWHLQDGRPLGPKNGRHEPAEIPSKPPMKDDGFGRQIRRNLIKMDGIRELMVDSLFQKQQSHSREIPYFFKCFSKGPQFQQHPPSISMPTRQGSGLRQRHKPTIWRWQLPPIYCDGRDGL